MASAPQQGLPLFYNDLIPISTEVHGNWKMKPVVGASFVRATHAVPLLAEEFIQASRFYPIVFSLGNEPVPLALMGLNDGVNAVVDEQGMFPGEWYVPAYVRRYPFMLARLRPDSDELSLCMDPTSDVVGLYEEGDPVFEGSQPSERTKEILQFCEQMEQGSVMTAAFFKEVSEQKMLIEGEFSAQPTGAPQPYVYRGFQIISEDAVKNLRGDIARKWIQSGLLPLIYAHLFSLQRMPDIFGRQVQLGMLPPPNGPVLG